MFTANNDSVNTLTTYKIKSICYLR